MLQLREEHIDGFAKEQRLIKRRLLVQDLEKSGLRVSQGINGSELLLQDSSGAQATLKGNERGTRVISGQGRALDFGFDKDSNLNRVRDQSGLVTAWDYDEHSRTLDVRRGEDAKYRFHFDSKQRLSSLTDAKGRPTNFFYRPDGKLLSYADRNGSHSRYEYDSNGVLIASIDPDGNKTLFRGRDSGGPEEIVFPNGDSYEFKYTEGGKVSRFTTSGRKHTDFEYGESELHAKFFDGSYTRLRWRDSNLLELAENSRGVTSFYYDSEGRVTEERSLNCDVEYLRNSLGYVVEMSIKGVGAVSFERDQEQRVSRISDWRGGIYEVQYAPNGTLSKICYPNSVVLTQVSNVSGTIDSLVIEGGSSGGSILKRRWKYDECDRLVKSIRNESEELSFEYDREGRLTSVSGGGKDERFELDSRGNISASKLGMFRINNANQVVEANGQHFEFDQLGNMTKGTCPRGVIHCRFDARSQLIATECGSKSVEYSYDAVGRRVQKKTKDKTTQFLWAGRELVGETVEASDGTLVSRYFLYIPGVPIPLAMWSGGQIYYLHPGRRGEILCMTDGSGRVVWEASYSAFGEATVTRTAVDQPWRLCGHYHDEETGLHYVLARYYDPVLGRYLSRDPLFFEGGSANLYIYCDGDPLNRVDPTGQFIFTAILIGAAVGAVIGAGIEAYRQHKQNGEITDGWAVAKAAGLGAVIGAIGGGVGAAAEGAFAVAVAATVSGGALVGGVSAAASSVAEQCAEAALTGQSLEPVEFLSNLVQDTIVGAGIGAVTAGAGGFLARRARKGAEEAIEGIVEAERRARARQRLQRHLEDVDAHRAKYERIMEEAEAAGASNRQLGGYKAKITEAKGERGAALYMAENLPEHRMVRGFEEGTGFDQVYRGDGGDGVEEILIVEAKGPGASLSTGAAKGDQMSREWVENSAREMAESSDEATKELGNEILHALENGPPPRVTGKVLEATEEGTATEVLNTSYTMD